MTTFSLIYNDHPINERGEMLSLTDMWRAAEGTDSQRPYEWLRTDVAEMFVDHISTVTGLARNELIQTLRGNEAGTWAHWQIGMAYAKYLSPEFHAWCNQKVRDHMEGRNVPVQTIPAVISVTDEMFREMMLPMTQGIRDILDAQNRSETRFEKVEHRLNEHQRQIKGLYEAVNRRRRAISQGNKFIIIRDTGLLGGSCPCCGTVLIVADGKIVSSAEFDHFYANSAPDADHVWLICRDCHAELTRHVTARDERNAEFQAFQSKRRRLPGAQLRLIEGFA